MAQPARKANNRTRDAHARANRCARGAGTPLKSGPGPPDKQRLARGPTQRPPRPGHTVPVTY
eukprot:6549192-Lingulodinium_polyedra.AAC.1